MNPPGNEPGTAVAEEGITVEPPAAKFKPRAKHFWIAGIVVALLGGAGIGVVLAFDLLDEIRGFFDATLAWLDRLPWPAAFAAIAILPALSFPVSPLYIVLGQKIGLLATFGAVAINLSLCYVLGRYLLHGFLERLLTRMGYKIPTVTDGQATFIVMIRINPAIPMQIQSYLLGIARIPFLLYLALSLPIQCAIAAGFIFFGEGLFQGNLTYILVGVALILTVIFVRKLWIRSREKAKSKVS